MAVTTKAATPEGIEGYSELTGVPVPRYNPLIEPLAKELPGLKDADKATITREYLTKKLPNWGKLKSQEQDQLVTEVVGKYGKTPFQNIKDMAKQAMSSPETALRIGGGLALQGGGMLVGERLGGGIGERAGGAAGSVLNDLYQRFLNHMYGEPNAPLSLRREEISALSGALAPAVPTVAGAVAEGATGLRTVRKTAEAAAEDARTEGTKLTQQQGKIQAELASKRKDAQGALEKAKAGPSVSDVHAAGQAELTKANRAHAKIESDVADARTKLAEKTRSDLEKARPAVAERVGTEKIQGMLGKTPRQLAQQEAMPSGEKYAALRSSVMAPVFDGARQYHSEVGKLFDPFIGPHEKEALSADGLDQLRGSVAQLTNDLKQRGQIVTNTDLNRIMQRIQGPAHESEQLHGFIQKDMQELGHGELLQRNPTAESLRLQNYTEKQISKILAEHAQAQPLTIGELWGYRSRAAQVLARSNNPTERYVAHQVVDAITEQMPNIPVSVRARYATERAQFPAKLLREVATARTPAEMGAAIFGSPTTPEPAQVALNLIRRATTPEAKEGLKTAFADNWLSKPHGPDDIGRFNPAVIKGLYGDSAQDVYSILGHEGTVKSASWQKLIASSSVAKPEFDKTYRASIESHQSLNYRQAIREGERALEAAPRELQANFKAAIAKARTPEEKIAALQKALDSIEPSEKQAEILAKPPPNPRQAAIDALTGKMVATPRMERYAQHRLAFDGLLYATTGAGALFKHPEFAYTVGAIIGGRAAIKYALTRPEIAKAYVSLLRLEATPAHAGLLGKGLGALASAATLQAVKENPDLQIGEPALSQRPESGASPANP